MQWSPQDHEAPLTGIWWYPVRTLHLWGKQCGGQRHTTSLPTADCQHLALRHFQAGYRLLRPSPDFPGPSRCAWPVWPHWVRESEKRHLLELRGKGKEAHHTTHSPCLATRDSDITLVVSQCDATEPQYTRGGDGAQVKKRGTWGDVVHCKRCCTQATERSWSTFD